MAGGTGLIGTPLHYLLIEEEDAEVTVASVGYRMRVHPKARSMELDLTYYENCWEVCRGMDYVFNLLCLKGSPQFMKEKPATAFDANLDLETNMLRAAQACGVGGYFLTSSIGVYPAAEVFFEDDAATDRLPSKNDRAAGFAKLVGEIQAQLYAIEHGMKISIVRPANTYGPLDDFDSDRAMVVPSLIRRVYNGEDPLVIRGRSNVRDMVFSEDVARGMLHIAKLEETRPVNLGSGIGYTIGELAETVVRHARKKPRIVYDDTEKSGGDTKRVLDISRAQSLGWAPEISLDEGIKKSTSWYEQNKLFRK